MEVYDRIIDNLFKLFSHLKNNSYIDTSNDYMDIIFYPFEVIYATDFKITNKPEAFQILFEYIKGGGEIKAKCVGDCLRQHVQNVCDIYEWRYGRIDYRNTQINKPSYEHKRCVVLAMQLIIEESWCNTLNVFKSHFAYLEKIAKEYTSTENMYEKLKYRLLYQYLSYLYSFMIIKDIKYQNMLDFIKEMQDELYIERNMEEESVSFWDVNEELI